MAHPPLFLYHRIADTDSARARRLVQLYQIKGVGFLNVDANEQARKDLIEKTGADQVPALRVGEDRWFFGSLEIENYFNPQD